MSYTAHVDTFAADNLPPVELQPDYVFELPELQFPERLNCAAELLDRHVKEGRGDRLCIHTGRGSALELRRLATQGQPHCPCTDRGDGLAPGNRVLLCGPNNLMLVACWFGVVKVALRWRLCFHCCCAPRNCPPSWISRDQPRATMRSAPKCWAHSRRARH